MNSRDEKSVPVEPDAVRHRTETSQVRGLTPSGSPMCCAFARPRDTLSAREERQGTRRNQHNETSRRKEQANAQATGGPRGELAEYRSQKTAAGDETMSGLTIA